MKTPFSECSRMRLASSEDRWRIGYLVNCHRNSALPALIDAGATLREIAAIYNAPMDMLRAPKAVTALRRRRAEAAEAQAAASLVAEQAGAVKDLAQVARVVGGR